MPVPFSASAGPEKTDAVFNALVPTLATRIVEHVRRENYSVGQRMTELALAQALGVSRSPVRKALQFLADNQIVSTSASRGFELTKPVIELVDLDLGADRTPDEDTYLRLANDRINGLLPDELVESDVMQRYGLSRLQVQRILNRMAREGMMERKPGRGWLFRPLLTDALQHRQSYRFRMILEPGAILEPGYRVDAIELEKCRREQQELLDGGIERCTPAELFRAGVHFHETVVAGAGNPFLLDALQGINRMRRVVEYGTKLDRSRLYQQCTEHLKLIDLLNAGERMEAAHFLREHLNGARITKLGLDEMADKP
jgi:DNA-binding GntR family transcriptional regulator